MDTCSTTLTTPIIHLKKSKPSHHNLSKKPIGQRNKEHGKGSLESEHLLCSLEKLNKEGGASEARPILKEIERKGLGRRLIK